MTNLAEKLQPEEAFLEMATVERARAGAFVVRTGTGRAVGARQAAMCSIEPREGDRVLLASASEESFVIGVLEHDQPGPSRWTVEGDLEIRAPGGRVVIASQEGIDLATAGDASLTAAELNVNAQRGNLMVRSLRTLSERVQSEVGRLSVVAETVDQVVERVRLRAERCYRFVRQFDQVRAEHLDYRAKQVARVHAGDAVITADRVAKIDGTQVHIG